MIFQLISGASSRSYPCTMITAGYHFCGKLACKQIYAYKING
jgi:hypothetical protein